MKKTELVFIPVPATGHLVSTVEFANKLLSRDDRFSVTILVIKSPFESFSDSKASQSLAVVSNPSIQYLDIPTPLNLPPLEIKNTSTEKYLSLYVESHLFLAPSLHLPPIKDIIINRVLSKSVSFGGLVVDLFCTSTVDIAIELELPSYVFFTSGAGFLGLMLFLHTRHEQGGVEFKESDPESNIPSYANPVPARVLPSFAFNKHGGLTTFVHLARGIKKTKGIIVNTVLELESHAVNLLLDSVTPTLYPVGPLLDLEGKTHQWLDESQRDKIMKWLDHQPTKSVVFLCFGSFGSFSAPQLREIAIGLERSGQRFLWSVRKTSPEKMEMPSDYANPEEFLPEGFMERTEEIGMLCGWAPQVEVLAHRATGCFVSHCGWNSTLESLWFGVPMVMWPLYAEQQINAFQMVRDLGLAVELRSDYRIDGGNVVMGDEIEKAVRSAMDGDRDVRKRVQDASEKCRRAVVCGGSSFKSFACLIEAILANARLL